jgi:hypothetical protein
MKQTRIMSYGDMIFFVQVRSFPFWVTLGDGCKSLEDAQKIRENLEFALQNKKVIP